MITSHVKTFYVAEMAKPSKKDSVGNRKWLAVYTRPRWEKKVNQLLAEKGVERYCPLNKVRRKWSDRVKVVEEPLFKSYVFVKVNNDDRTEVRMTPGVINFVYWQGRPAVIKEREISAIKRFLDEYENVEVKPMDLKINQRVKITAGPLMDQEGKVLEVKRKMARIAIDSLGYILIASIERTKLTSARAR
jgi:transcription antitermination factor NusG